MIYIIGGASRSGKTTVAKKIALKKKIPYLSLDWLMMGFSNGLPDYGINHRQMPSEIARRIWPFLNSMFESMLFIEEKCIIEGEALLPELVTGLLEKYPNTAKACFLGYTSIDVNDKLKGIRSFDTKKSDWLANKSDEYVIDHIKNMRFHSRQIAASCKRNNLKYFEVSSNFEYAMNDVEAYFSI